DNHTAVPLIESTATATKIPGTPYGCRGRDEESGCGSEMVASLGLSGCAHLLRRNCGSEKSDVTDEKPSRKVPRQETLCHSITTLRSGALACESALSVLGP